MSDDRGSAPVAPHKGCILVVDDDEAARRVAITALSRAGYATLSAECGEEALDVFAKEGGADLVLLDINMPGIDGFATCERLRRLPSGGDTPIVFATAADDALTRAKALASEADDFLAKPIEKTELLMRVRSLVRLRRLNEERRKGFEALSESEERFRQLAENIDAAFWIRSVSPPRILYFSPAIERILGRRREELVADTDGYFSSVHPDDVPIARTALKNQAEGYDVEYRIVRPDGALRWLRSRAFPVKDQAGAVVRVAGLAEDVTEKRRAADDLETQKDFLAHLLQIARAGAERPSLAPTLRNIMGVVKRLTGSEGAAVFFLDDAGELRDTIFMDDHAPAALTADERRRLVTEGISGWVARHRIPARVADCTLDERWIPLTELEQEIRSLLCVPVATGDRLVGILNLVHGQVDHFTAEHQALLQAAGDQIALALRNAQMFDALDRMASRRDLLYQVLQLAARRLEDGRADDPRALLALATLIAERTAWRDVGIALASRSGNLHVRASGSLTWPPAGGGVHSFPLVRSGEELGALVVVADHAGPLGAEERQLAESLVDALALALENASLYQRATDEGRRLLSLIESSRDGILLVGKGGTIQVINEPACALLSLPGSAADYRSRPFAELRRALPDHPGPAELVRQLGCDEIAEGRYELGQAVSWRTVSVVAGEDSLGRLCVLHDRSEERNAERQREDLTNALVHDLRNPLTSVTGFLELLETGTGGAALPETQLALLRRARRAAERLRALIDSLLDIARLESGTMPLGKAPTDLARLIAEVLDLQAPQAAEKRLELVHESAGALPAAQVDAELVRRVLQNLIGNAVKFTPAGGTIRVSAEREPGDPRALRVRVRDTGPGLSPLVAGRLFEKFVTGPEKGHGTGLGLAFCRLAVEAHGGRIEAESAPEGGSTFTFTVPVA